MMQFIWSRPLTNFYLVLIAKSQEQQPLAPVKPRRRLPSGLPNFGSHVIRRDLDMDLSPELPLKRPIQIGNMSPETRPAKRFVSSNFKPMISSSSAQDDVLVDGTKDKPHELIKPTPFSSPATASHHDECEPMDLQDEGANENASNQHENDELSVAQVLTTLYSRETTNSNGSIFAAVNI